MNAYCLIPGIPTWYRMVFDDRHTMDSAEREAVKPVKLAVDKRFAVHEVLS